MRNGTAAVFGLALLIGSPLAAGAQTYQPYAYGYPYASQQAYANPSPSATPGAYPPGYPSPYPAAAPAPSTPAPLAAAAPQWDYSRLGPTTDTPRYDYPGPPLISGNGGGRSGE